MSLGTFHNRHGAVAEAVQAAEALVPRVSCCQGHVQQVEVFPPPSVDLIEESLLLVRLVCEIPAFPPLPDPRRTIYAYATRRLGPVVAPRALVALVQVFKL